MAIYKQFHQLFIVFTLFCVFETLAIQFILPGGEKRCLSEEIHKDVLVTGDYAVSEVPMHKISINVIDIKGHIFYQKEDITKGKFAFTADHFDTFQICFQSHVSPGMNNQDIEVALILKKGVETKNYADIAKAEKLKPMEVELKKLEDLSESIVNDFAYMRAREEEMRDTNESTHSRVLYFSLFSMACLLGLATWQVFYLRKYFKSKKLIE